MYSPVFQDSCTKTISNLGLKEIQFHLKLTFSFEFFKLWKKFTSNYKYSLELIAERGYRLKTNSRAHCRNIFSKSFHILLIQNPSPSLSNQRNSNLNKTSDITWAWHSSASACCLYNNKKILQPGINVQVLHQGFTSTPPPPSSSINIISKLDIITITPHTHNIMILLCMSGGYPCRLYSRITVFTA